MRKREKERTVSSRPIPKMSKTINEDIPKITKLLKKKMVQNLDFCFFFLPHRDKTQARGKEMNRAKTQTGIENLFHFIHSSIGTSIQFSTKSKRLKNFTDKELLAEITQRGFRVSGRLPEPISVRCFQCREQFLIKWVVTQQDYAKKNNWGYWTERKSDKNLKICNSCLRKFYIDNRQEFLTIVKDLKKRNNLRSYISNKLI